MLFYCGAPGCSIPSWNSFIWPRLALLAFGSVSHGIADTSPCLHAWHRLATRRQGRHTHSHRTRCQVCRGSLRCSCERKALPVDILKNSCSGRRRQSPCLSHIMSRKRSNGKQDGIASDIWITARNDSRNKVILKLFQSLHYCCIIHLIQLFEWNIQEKHKLFTRVSIAANFWIEFL